MKILTEKEVMTKFRSNKRNLIKVLGRKSTTDRQLSDVGRKLFGKKYIGTFSQDYKPNARPNYQFFIINTDTKGGPGEHWVAVVKNNNTYYIYDSFGRKAHKLLHVFTKGKLIIESDLDAEQRGASQVCGVLCISWLQVVNDFGIRNALKV